MHSKPGKSPQGRVIWISLKWSLSVEIAGQKTFAQFHVPSKHLFEESVSFIKTLEKYQSAYLLEFSIKIRLLVRKNVHVLSQKEFLYVSTYACINTKRPKLYLFIAYSRNSNALAFPSQKKHLYFRRHKQTSSFYLKVGFEHQEGQARMTSLEHGAYFPSSARGDWLLDYPQMVKILWIFTN